MPLLKLYQQLIKENTLQVDQAQQHALNVLNTLLHNINTSDYSAHKGVYLWGKVGRGKTMMMDMFYHQLAIKNKQRIHFHHFMEAVHKRLNELTGKDEPLTRIAGEWSKKVQVLCFDEFFVNDIGDAMLLTGLFKALFLQGVILVATSNCQPEQLYRNGLLRERFLPTIALLNQYCQVISVNGEQDHRLSQLIDYTCYYFPAEQHQKTLMQKFQQLSRQQAVEAGEITINHRNINYLAKSDTVIWFDFFALCSGPRSQRDYIQIAKQFTTVIIANVPQFSGKLIPAVFSGIEDGYQRSGVLLGGLRQLDDEARRFIALVDEFYEQKVQLVVSAEVDIFTLYQAEQLAFEFARCESRLIEMQSAQYAGKHKKAIN
ncbi:MAG: AFG1 family ATPase [Alteromonadaceae bacterium]|nr:AFG1 family ATPase [Alteromonadaceae bacterium]